MGNLVLTRMFPCEQRQEKETIIAVYIFHIRALRNVYPYVAKYQIHTHKIRFIIH
jgi:hypothetical protein